MPTADFSSYHQPAGTEADGTKFDNFIDAVQTAVNGLDNNNIAANAGIVLSKLSGPYSAFIPVLSASGGGSPTVGNGTITGRYIQVDKHVHFVGRLIFGSTTSLGTGDLHISLPVTAALSGINLFGHGYGFDSSASALAFLAAIPASATDTYLTGTATHNGVNTRVSGSTPFPWTWATSDELNWNILYEAA